jgi:hypothetical protein
MDIVAMYIIVSRGDGYEVDRPTRWTGILTDGQAARARVSP